VSKKELESIIMSFNHDAEASGAIETRFGNSGGGAEATDPTQNIWVTTDTIGEVTFKLLIPW
jgi:hypothetical protein